MSPVTLGADAPAMRSYPLPSCRRILGPCLALIVGASAGTPARADAPPEDELHELDEMLEEQPTSVNLLLERAIVLAEMRRFDDAMSTLTRAEWIARDDRRIAVQRARIELARGRADVARHALEAHLRRHPDDRSAWLAHAAACEALDDVDTAIDDLRAAQVVHFDDALALRIARLMRARGHRDDADRTVLEAAAREPAHPATMLEAIAVLRRRGASSEALAMVDRLARGAAVPTQMELLRAEILLESGRRREAAEAFRRALALANRTLAQRVSAAALVHRARARMGLSDFADARVDLDAARSLAPRMPEIGRLLEAVAARRNVP